MPDCSRNSARARQDSERRLTTMNMWLYIINNIRNSVEYEEVNCEEFGYETLLMASPLR